MKWVDKLDISKSVIWVINDFKTEIAQSEFPTTNILESLLANLYWQYFQENRHTFYNRTKTEEKVDTVDFRTWDLQTLFEEIHLHFKNSLKSGLMLQQEDLKQYNVLLQVAAESKIYRPTLYDFLAHTALEFYKTCTYLLTILHSFLLSTDDKHFMYNDSAWKKKLNIK